MNIVNKEMQSTSLTKISDAQLLQQTDRIAKQERELLSEVLHHLREIETRS